MSDELKTLEKLKKIEKAIMFKRILFKKISVIHGKGFLKLRKAFATFPKSCKCMHYFAKYHGF